MDGSTGMERDKHRGGGTPMKRYQEMLVKGMLGTSRPNEPLQAVVENKLNETALTETNNSILERNRALLQYIATIANSNSSHDEFNYEFVESLVNGGADINTADQYQQTIFHEVARSWNLDVARFLLDIGCDINKQDCFGRSPLHVAASVDYVEMTQFLLDNNANIDARTFGEQQAPIHYAAKNGAVQSLKMLLAFDADINSADGKQRTPLQLAAEWTRDKTVKVLLDEGASSCLLDTSGNSALCVLIDRLPHLAVEALDQLHSTDVITMKESYYLHFLEASRLKKETKRIRTPLETAVTTRKFEVVTHPVMKRLIHSKWMQYGRFSTIIDLLFHVLYGILWTIVSTGTPSSGKELWEPWDNDLWRKILGAITAIMTMYDIFILVQTTIKSRKSQKAWVVWRTGELEDDMKYCHPRWPQEKKYVEIEVKRLKSLAQLNTLGAWFYLEWIVIILIMATTVTHFVYYTQDTKATRYLYTRTISIVNLLVWLRLLKYVRPFPGIGTLVIILGETSKDFVNWAFLYFLLLIPFSAAFWINFGDISLHPVEGYEDGNRLLYSVFRIAVGDDFNLEGLVKADPVMSRILIVLYVTSVTIVTLNLLIALLADTFTRVYSNAVANTIMQRALKVVNAESTLTKKGRMKYQEYIKMNCSPELLDMRVDDWSSEGTEKTAEKEMQHQLMSMNVLILDRFGAIYGKNKTSDFDAIIQDLRKLKMYQDELSNELARICELLNMYAGLPDSAKAKEGGKRQRRERRDSKRNYESDEEQSKNFVSTLQDAAASLFQSLMTRNTDDKKSSATGSKRKKSYSSRNESRERSSKGRRRGQRELRDSSDEMMTPLVNRRIRRPRELKHDGESTAVGNHYSNLALARRDPSREGRMGYQNQAVTKDDSAWENVSIDSIDVEL